jgi:tetratricopeptide (TPR) repeat protein
METDNPTCLDCFGGHVVKIDPEEFVALVRKPLEERNTAKLARLVHDHWTDQDISSLLDSGHDDARKLATLALGLVGDVHCVTALATQLRDRDPMVNQMAEHALWTIWFRAGTPSSHQRVLHGTRLMNAKQYEDAEEAFCQAIDLDPVYAEAYNQRSLARYLMENYRLSVEDAGKTVQLMPMHFGAWAGMGHCYAHLGQRSRALECYHRALAVNPYLQCIRQIIHELETPRPRPGAAARPARRL